MKRILLSLILLAACQEEAPLPDPVALNAETVGFFCQMNILDHGGPKAQVHLDVFPGKPLFFSQVRDAVAYLRMPEKDGAIVATYVTDMGGADWNDPTQADWIAADKAAYVVGSHRLGGMDQPEFIPFADAAAARDFATRNGGQVFALADIPTEALASDEPAAPGDAEDFAARLKSATESQ
jgi:copper chaperone NosL